jgi:NADPH:quinone reductase
MQGWFCDDLEGEDALRWRDASTPTPAAGEALVRVHAASLNFPDLLTVAGKYQIKPPLPFVPGSEFAGVVQAVGQSVTNVRVGDRVAALGSHGGFATHACTNARTLLPLPQEMPFEHGAAFAFTYGTSYHALVDRGAMQAGQTVLVLGAAGGVGTAAVQIAKAAGARVIAAASGPEKSAWCSSIGADAVVDVTTQDLRETLKALTQGKGPDIVYDPVGGALAEPAFRSIAWRGRYLVIGFAAGSIPSLPLNLALLKGASIVGVFWGDFVRREPAAFAKDLHTLGVWYGQGKVRPVIDRVLPLSDLSLAYAAMRQRRVRGKVVLVPPGIDRDTAAG